MKFFFYERWDCSETETCEVKVFFYLIYNKNTPFGIKIEGNHSCNNPKNKPRLFTLDPNVIDKATSKIKSGDGTQEIFDAINSNRTEEDELLIEKIVIKNLKRVENYNSMNISSSWCDYISTINAMDEEGFILHKDNKSSDDFLVIFKYDKITELFLKNYLLQLSYYKYPPLCADEVFKILQPKKPIILLSFINETNLKVLPLFIGFTNSLDKLYDFYKICIEHISDLVLDRFKKVYKFSIMTDFASIAALQKLKLNISGEFCHFLCFYHIINDIDKNFETDISIEDIQAIKENVSNIMKKLFNSKTEPEYLSIYKEFESFCSKNHLTKFFQYYQKVWNNHHEKFTLQYKQNSNVGILNTNNYSEANIKSLESKICNRLYDFKSVSFELKNFLKLKFSDTLDPEYNKIQNSIYDELNNKLKLSLIEIPKDEELKEKVKYISELKFEINEYKIDLSICPTCTCINFRDCRRPCKHIFGVFRLLSYFGVINYDSKGFELFLNFLKYFNCVSDDDYIDLTNHLNDTKIKGDNTQISNKLFSRTSHYNDNNELINFKSIIGVFCYNQKLHLLTEFFNKASSFHPIEKICFTLKNYNLLLSFIKLLNESFLKDLKSGRIDKDIVVVGVKFGSNIEKSINVLTISKGDIKNNSLSPIDKSIKSRAVSTKHKTCCYISSVKEIIELLKSSKIEPIHSDDNSVLNQNAVITVKVEPKNEHTITNSNYSIQSDDNSVLNQNDHSIQKHNGNLYDTKSSFIEPKKDNSIQISIPKHNGNLWTIKWKDNSCALDNYLVSIYPSFLLFHEDFKSECTTAYLESTYNLIRFMHDNITNPNRKEIDDQIIKLKEEFYQKHIEVKYGQFYGYSSFFTDFKNHERTYRECGFLFKFSYKMTLKCKDCNKSLDIIKKSDCMLTINNEFMNYYDIKEINEKTIKYILAYKSATIPNENSKECCECDKNNAIYNFCGEFKFTHVPLIFVISYDDFKPVAGKSIKIGEYLFVKTAEVVLGGSHYNSNVLIGNVWYGYEGMAPYDGKLHTKLYDIAKYQSSYAVYTRIEKSNEQIENSIEFQKKGSKVSYKSIDCDANEPSKSKPGTKLIKSNEKSFKSTVIDSFDYEDTVETIESKPGTALIKVKFNALNPNKKQKTK
jgi:hypothetical protein